jgi:predicted nucleic acid-binding protein
MTGGNAAVMLNNGVRRIATFDADFDRVPKIARVELV